MCVMRMKLKEEINVAAVALAVTVVAMHNAELCGLVDRALGSGDRICGFKSQPR